MMWNEYGGYGWAWMALGMIVFWTVLILIAVAAYGALTRGSPESPGRRRDARALLDDRLARGELDVEEYHARCRALEDAGR